jgi:actin-like ATPase involved in cell morphogenesis
MNAGVDIGTINSRLGIVRSGQSGIRGFGISFAEEAGIPNVPSAIAQYKAQLMIGQRAIRALQQGFPSSRYIKRLIGTSESILIGDHTFSPAEFTSLLLVNICELATKQFSEKIRQLVLTIPAYWTASQKEILLQAAEMAKVEPALLIPEPVAAVIDFYNISGEQGSTTLCYDFGGGTFDAAVIEGDRTEFNVIANEGDLNLGGLDIDDCIVNWITNRMADGRITAQESKSQKESQLRRERLRALAEHAKIDLSRNTATRIQDPCTFRDCDGDPVPVDIPITRDDLDDLSKDLIDRTFAITENMLDRSQVRREEIDHIVVVGGSSLQRLVQNRFADMFPNHVVHCVDPLTSVAAGAASVAAMLPEKKSSEFASSGLASTQAEKSPFPQDSHDTTRNMRFSAFFPETVIPETVGRVLVYAFNETVSPDKIAREARNRINLPRKILMKGKTSDIVHVRSGSILTVTAQSEDLIFTPAQTELTIWEDVQSIEFRFRVLHETADRFCKGQIDFWSGPVLLASLIIKVIVITEEAPDIMSDSLAQVNGHPYRYVFPSYAHSDGEVVKMIAIYAKAFGDEYLRDICSLRTGQTWSNEILEYIDKADVFQLFWSPNAASSQYVTEEWNYALSARSQRMDPTFIRPVYWTDNILPDPPPLLKPIQFTRLLIPGMFTE